MSRSPSRSPSQTREDRRDRSRSRSRSEPRGAGRERNEEYKREERRSRKDENGDSNSILVRNLNYRTSPDELRKIFTEFGDVTDVYLPLDYNTKRPRGFGFVQFSSSDVAHAACKAIDQTEIEGNKVEVVIAQQNRKSPTTMRKLGRGGRYDDNRRDDRRRGGDYGRGYRESEYRRGGRSRSRSGGRRDRGDYYNDKSSYSRRDDKRERW